MTARYGEKQWSKLMSSNFAIGCAIQEASRLGWAALTTSRNSPGPDVILLSRNGTTKLALQVKGLERPSDLPVGSAGSLALCDYLLVVQWGGPTSKMYCARTKRVVRDILDYYETPKIPEGQLWLHKDYYVKWPNLERTIGRGNR